MSSLPTVAIAGATGQLGTHITNTFLSPSIRPSFASAILLTRQKSEKTAEWEANGATIRVYDQQNLAASFVGVDILINVIGSTGHAFKENLALALPQTAVKLYLPSEFGVDHRIHDFSHPEWVAKKNHVSTVRQNAPSIHVCQVFVGLFLETSIAPAFGFDAQARKYEAVGSADVPISFTSKADIARAVAALVSLPLDRIPEQIHIAGSSASIRDIAAAMSAAGAGQIDVSVLGLQEYKQGVLAEKTRRPAKDLRFLMGEGKINQQETGLGNQNGLINPGERGWKWRTVSDLAAEKAGKP